MVDFYVKCFFSSAFNVKILPLMQANIFSTGREGTYLPMNVKKHLRAVHFNNMLPAIVWLAVKYVKLDTAKLGRGYFQGSLYLWCKMLIFSPKLFLKKFRAHFHEASD